MINSTLNFLTGKNIILYDHHRQTLPITNHPINKQKFLFFNIEKIWKHIPFKTSDKRKHKIMYCLLTWIRPKYILSMNWLSKRESLYKVWTAKNKYSKFIVVQHGAYVGGVVTDVPHKYIRSDIFLTWGSYFVEQFKAYNSLKKIEIVNFGNTVYNTYNRDSLAYRDTNSNKVLLLPTALNETDILPFYELIGGLKQLNYDIVVKPHNKQGKEKNQNGVLKYPIIEGVQLISGQLYPILQKNDFEFVVADHSSALLDVIFFKNKVLYFDPHNNTKGYTTQYSKYLANIFLEDYSKMDKNSLNHLISIDKQEALFNNMVRLGNNEIDSTLIK